MRWKEAVLFLKNRSTHEVSGGQYVGSRVFLDSSEMVKKDQGKRALIKIARNFFPMYKKTMYQIIKIQNLQGSAKNFQKLSPVA